MSEKQPSPYGDAVGFLLIGVILAGIGAGIMFGAPDDVDGGAKILATVLLGIGGLLAQIGAIATGVVMGTMHLRGRGGGDGA